MATFELLSGTNAEPTRIKAPTRAPEDEITAFQGEISHYLAEMQQFQHMEPDLVMAALSGYSARASEIRTWLVRKESRRANYFRTQEIDKFLEEVDRQYKFHSRIQAIRDFDLRMTGGAPG